MKYDLYIKKSEGKSVKRVKFDNGEDYAVHIDKDGREYFYIPNVKDEEDFKLFSGKIKDAIEAIRNDDGDALWKNGIFGKSEAVIKFVDREYGRKIRAKTIEGFKNAEFGYSLQFGYKSTFRGARFIAKDYSILSIMDRQSNYIFFDTYDEAEKAKHEIIKSASAITDKYKEITNVDSKKEFIAQNKGMNIVNSLWADIYNKNDWLINIVQVIKISDMQKESA